MFKIKGDDIVERIFDVFIGILGVALLVGGNAIVFSRIIKYSAPWSQEVLQYSFVWLLFFGAAFSSKKWLIAVSIIDDYAANHRKGTMYKIVRLIQIFFTAVFAVCCTIYAFQYALSQLQKGAKSLSMDFSLGYFTMGVAVAFALMVIYQCVKFGYFLINSGDKVLPAKGSSENEADAAT